jgi:hypothetical protein
MSIKNNVTVDWMHRETARARMRVLVKRLLRKYGYQYALSIGSTARTNSAASFRKSGVTCFPPLSRAKAVQLF